MRVVMCKNLQLPDVGLAAGAKASAHSALASAPVAKHCCKAPHRAMQNQSNAYRMAQMQRKQQQQSPWLAAFVEDFKTGMHSCASLRCAFQNDITNGLLTSVPTQQEGPMLGNVYGLVHSHLLVATQSPANLWQTLTLNRRVLSCSGRQLMSLAGR